MRKSIKKYCFLVLVMIPILLFAQSEKDLRKTQEDIRKKLAQTKKLLSKTSSKKKASLLELNLINQQLKDRERLISSIKKQEAKINQTIEERNENIKGLREESLALKDSYASMIQYAYKTRNSYDQMVFLFAAESFNDAVTRFKYIQRINDGRQKKVNELVDLTDQINLELADLELKKEEQNKLLEAEKEERSKIINEKKSKDRILGELKKKEKDLKADLKKKEKSIKKLDDQITKLIKKSIKKAKKDNSSVNNAAIAALSTDFVKNKGRLPWPVDQGIVVKRFGKNKHPVLPGIVTNSGGVEFATVASAPVRAIFKGKVENIWFYPVIGNNIIVKHGDYFTLYSNVDEVKTEIGAEIKAGQIVGTAGTDPVSGKSTVHLEVWKGVNKLDPSKWLIKK